MIETFTGKVLRIAIVIIYMFKWDLYMDQALSFKKDQNQLL